MMIEILQKKNDDWNERFAIGKKFSCMEREMYIKEYKYKFFFFYL